MNGSGITQHAGAIVLAALVASAGAACQATAAAPAADQGSVAASPAGHAVPVPLPDAAISGLIDNASVAVQHGDWRALRGFQAQLIDRLGLAAVSEARAAYQRVNGDLDEADGVGDSRARAEFRAQLRALCRANPLVRAFERCDADVTGFGL
jgi:hypothetical protein